MVVTSQHLATQVGIDILKQGGNAIDAAVAVGYALSVVEPCCGNIGGGGFMLLHLKNGKNIVINFREKAPLKANANLYLDKQGRPIVKKMLIGYLPVAIPGTVMGMNTALEKYGTLPLEKVIRPAIQLAEQGFKLRDEDVDMINHELFTLKTNSNVNSIFTRHGKLLRTGDKLVQKELARTLKKIASGGTKAFYEREIADQIVRASQKNGGVLSKQDFLNYTIEIQEPIVCNYRGYKILSAPPPSSGGVTLCEMLNITSGYPLSKLGYHNPEGLHDILEAMRFAYADRNHYLGDPNFVQNPIHALLSPEHATAIRAQIKPFKAGNSKLIHNTLGQTKEKPQTTHYSIVDAQGNAAAVTYTLNGFFGSQVIAENTGFFLNNEMDDFALQPGVPNEFKLIQGNKNAIQPQKRPLSSITPTLVFNQGKLFMVLGAPGGSTIPTQVLETLENVIDYHLTLQQAVNAPRFHMQWLPDVVFVEPHAFSASVMNALKKMGYRFHLGSPFDTTYWGAVAAILIEPHTGELIGAIDSRRPQGLAQGIIIN